MNNDEQEKTPETTQTSDEINKENIINILLKWKKWSLEHPKEKLFEKLDEKDLIEKIQEKPLEDKRTITQIVQETPEENKKTITQIVQEKPIEPFILQIQEFIEKEKRAESLRFPYHYTITTKMKNMPGYRSFGVYLPSYYNVYSLEDRHIIFQQILESYESADDEDFENEIYKFGFNDIIAIQLKSPGLTEIWPIEYYYRK